MPPLSAVTKLLPRIRSVINMSSINVSALNSSDYSTLLSSLSSSSSSGSSGISSLLGDYVSIKNGSYGKLLKAYYAKQSKETSSANTDTDKTLSTVKSDASTLQSAAAALTSSSLYQKGSYKVTSADGKTTTDSEYNYDNIYDKVSSFVSSYNTMVKAGAASETSSVNSKTTNLVSLTSSNSDLLKTVGITAKTDGTLSIDEDKFKKADINTIKSLFEGNGSYADSVANKSSLINQLAANKLSGSTSYSASGSYNTSSAIDNLYNTVT